MNDSRGPSTDRQQIEIVRRVTQFVSFKNRRPNRTDLGETLVFLSRRAVPTPGGQRAKHLWVKETKRWQLMFCNSRGFTTTDFVEDLVNALGPDERFWVGVVVSNVVFDGCGEFSDAAKAAAADAFASNFGKPPFDQVKPG